MFSDLVDGDGEAFGLDLVGSSFVTDVSVTYYFLQYINPEVTGYYAWLSACLSICMERMFVRA